MVSLREFEFQTSVNIRAAYLCLSLPVLIGRVRRLVPWRVLGQSGCLCEKLLDRSLVKRRAPFVRGRPPAGPRTAGPLSFSGNWRNWAWFGSRTFASVLPGCPSRRSRPPDHQQPRDHGMGQSTRQFPDETRLCHAPLRDQQGMGSVPNPFFQHFRLDPSIKEAASPYPVASAISRHGLFPTGQLATLLLGNIGRHAPGRPS